MSTTENLPDTTELSVETETGDFEDVADEETQDPQLVEIPPPNIRNTTFGPLQEVWRMWRHRKKRAKLLSNGYVQWYLVEDSYPTPKYVKPELEGGGVPELKHDGERYLFPTDARLASEKQGMWTFAHRKGEALPINLRDSTSNAIGADELEEYLTQRVSSSPPSFWDKFDFEPDEVLKWGLVLFILIIIGYSLVSGGGI